MPSMDSPSVTQIDAPVRTGDYTANSILAATTANVPAALTLAEDRVVGRLAGGAIAALTGTQSRAVVMRAEDARGYAARWSLAADGLAGLLSSGLTTSSGYVAASSDGTDGTAIFPLWGGTEFRASFRVKCTKATGGSKSYVGMDSSGTRGTVTSAGSWTFGVGYVQGTGLVVIKENVGSSVLLVADATITDGDEYDVVLQNDATSAARSSSSGCLSIVVRTSAGALVMSTLCNYAQPTFLPKNVLVRTNVAAGGVTGVQVSGHPLGTIGASGANLELPYSSTSGEICYMRTPAASNGFLVIACGGHGQAANTTDSEQIATWDALTAAGYTVAIPRLVNGASWGNNAVQAYLAELHTNLVADYDLGYQVFLWGDSMGAGAALTAAAKKTLPVRAMYLAEAACDLSALWANPSFSTLPTAYGNDTALRAANDPMQFAASAFAGVPMLFTASASDTVISKTAHTDAMRTKLGATVPNYLIAATGNHGDASHFRPRDVVGFFGANI